MARLVVKRTPWWVAHKKWVMVALPLATLQAATLVGFGYFYHRLDSLEQHTENTLAPLPSPQIQMPVKPLATTEQDVPAPGKDTTLHGEKVPLTSEIVTQVLKTSSNPKHQGVSKTTVTAVKESVKPAVANVLNKSRKEKVEHPTVDKKRVDVVAVANHAGLQRSQPARPAPVKAGVWVYLGELRDYGWYGQMLHISPSSRLPETGRAYQTQYIQRVYASPYGKVIKGEFHLGEWVYLHEVVRGRKNDVWGRVSPR